MAAGRVLAAASLEYSIQRSNQNQAAKKAAMTWFVRSCSTPKTALRPIEQNVMAKVSVATRIMFRRNGVLVSALMF